MAGRRKLIVVSNRGPVAYARDEAGERVARRGGGGLATALRSLVADHDVIWVASAMSDEDRAAASEAGGESIEEEAHDGSRYRLRLVVHQGNEYERFYNVVANPLLWFVQHYLWGLSYAPEFDPRVHDAWEHGYVPVNRTFAEVVLVELERTPDATVFFHDYHLYLAPRFVREGRPDAVLAQFVHIPWPQPDYWHVLPERIRAAIHDGLLANDVVGFHSARWQRSFLRASEDVVGAECDHAAACAWYGGRRVQVTADPISIDPSEFEELARSDTVLAAERRLAAERPERLVVRVDRTDPSKNVVRGFRAFDLYLERHPEAHGRVAMLTQLDPSRQAIAEYADYCAAIERAAQAVNDRFGRPGWTPIDLRIEDNLAESIAAYKQFDVLLVNAVFDGLNLVAKEGALLNERAGVVVLSENAGVHDELGRWAVSVNPFDVSGQADALHHALELPEEERRARLDAMREHVRAHDVRAWAAAQVAHFDRAAAERATAVASG